MSTKVIVIGAGASGLVAAGFLAQRGAEVHVLEKMQRAALKIRNSGKGRCNITNDMPIRDFIPNYPGNGRFLYGALHRFSNLDCIRFFEELGVKTKVERGQRVFPVSDDAHEVANALEGFARRNGARFHFEHKAVAVNQAPDGEVCGVVSVHNGKEVFFEANRVVIATGGTELSGYGLHRGRTGAGQEPWPHNRPAPACLGSSAC